MGQLWGTWHLLYYWIVFQAPWREDCGRARLAAEYTWHGPRAVARLCGRGREIQGGSLCALLYSALTQRPGSPPRDGR